ncbi:MAG TPA: hypothetical protein VNG53_01785 [Bacteroidia bacterium]|nr:hypothetical protein [Bacteroidia bacterium]
MEDVADLMSNCSDEELFEFVNDYRKYEEAAVLAALQEVEKRGKLSEEAKQLKNTLLQKLNITDENAVVVDPQIQLFSEWTVFGFSIFSLLLGVILFSYNLNKIGKSNKIVFPILFASTYVIILGTILNQLQLKIQSHQDMVFLIFPFICSFFGAIVMKEFFWKRYIGKSVAYTKKSNIVPILIGLAVIVYLMISFIMNGGVLLLPK